MWQVLLSAAIVGYTGLVAKCFLFDPFSSPSPDSDHHAESQYSDGVFRFSSSGPGFVSRKSSRVNSRVRIRGLKKTKMGHSGHEIKKKSGSDVPSKRRGSVCLKARRTSEKNDTARSKRGFCPDDQDCSVLSSALGVYIIHMMSAGKSEISKLNAAMEENTKFVQELKTELLRRKSSRNLRALGCAHGTNTSSMKPSGKSGQVDLCRSDMISRGSHDTKPINIPLSDDAEYASSVLTDEPEPEIAEMDQLEMELESEQLKLNLAESDEHMERHNCLVDGSESCQYGGVSPLELDKKLSQLLIVQQEGQIKELKAELQTVQYELQEKDAELQALKDCVRRLTDFSASIPSDDDDDDEPDEEQNLPISRNQRSQTDHEPSKLISGTKRPLTSSLHV